MAVSRQKKKEVLAELVELFKDAKSVSFGQYAGMSVKEISTMRNEMRESGVKFKVAKRTLFKLAAKEIGIELPNEIIEGTVGAAFSFDDVVSGPKLIKATSKKVEVVKLMGGIMEGKVLTITQTHELADLPSRDELLAKFVGMMQGPLRGFHGALNSGLGSFARTLTAYAEQLPAEDAPAPAPVAEAPKEEATEAPAEEATPAEEPATADSEEKSE
ncbi:MAG: large subunit ribosomal protein L10 [Oceanicoccus sp.]|jgi:large subunit ribosomal protein L10